jgi:hypothetical protein
MWRGQTPTLYPDLVASLLQTHCRLDIKTVAENYPLPLCHHSAFPLDPCPVLDLLPGLLGTLDEYHGVTRILPQAIPSQCTSWVGDEIRKEGFGGIGVRQHCVHRGCRRWGIDCRRKLCTTIEMDMLTNDQPSRARLTGFPHVHCPAVCTLVSVNSTDRHNPFMSDGTRRIDSIFESEVDL